MSKSGNCLHAAMYWVVPTALIAVLVIQTIHEGVHAVAALLLGAQVDSFGFYMVQTSWPAGSVNTAAKDGVIAGSAAIVNILLALACIGLFSRLQRPAGWRLFVFYLGAYSYFLGFGYLFIDAIRASPEALGDWARVVMLLGGTWPVRVAVGGAGGIGTVVGYFWMGRAAQHFTHGDMRQSRDRIGVGAAVCLAPYLVVNVILTALAWWQGSTAALFAIFAYWGSYIGFFWAFMIKFVWSGYEGPFQRETPLPTSRALWPAAAAGVLLIVTATVLAEGIPFR